MAGKGKISSYSTEKARQCNQYENFIILSRNFNKEFYIVNTKIDQMNWKFHEIALSWNDILRLFTSKWVSPAVALNSKILTSMVRNREGNHYLNWLLNNNYINSISITKFNMI